MGRQQLQDSHGEMNNTEIAFFYFLGKVYPAYEPLWFQNETDPQTGGVCHVFTEEYWRSKEAQDWSRCPDIYLNPESLPTPSNV